MIQLAGALMTPRRAAPHASARRAHATLLRAHTLSCNALSDKKQVTEHFLVGGLRR